MKNRRRTNNKYADAGSKQFVKKRSLPIVGVGRPGKAEAIKDVGVSMLRPRDLSSAAFNELRKELSLLVMEEQSRHNLHEIKLPAGD